MVHKIKSGLFLVILFFLAGCQGDISSIPDLYVNVVRNIDTYKLNSSNSYLYIPKPVTALDATGFGGIIIVHDLNDNNYYAFDLACPVEADRNVKIGKPDLNFICECPSCGEKYDLKWGHGVPKINLKNKVLKRYSVSPPDSYNNLYVTN